MYGVLTSVVCRGGVRAFTAGTIKHVAMMQAAWESEDQELTLTRRGLDSLLFATHTLKRMARLDRARLVDVLWSRIAGTGAR